jgi:PEGA domain-containing protein
METAVGEPFAQAAQPFVDGLGERRVTIDIRGERLDILRLKAALGSVPSFESALRERAGRIAGFRHESFSRVRAIEIEKATGTLLVVSDHVRGVRLSTLLAAAEKRSVAMDLPAATRLIRQLVHAASAWREQMPDSVHGAIGPDRIMVTPDGRLVVVETVLGSALEQLRYSRQRYWEELGVPVPASFTLTVNARADVLQVGAVALALILGRRLTPSDRLDEIPSTLNDDVPSDVRLWISRAMQLEPVGSFTSVLDARAALDQAFGEADIVEEQDSLLLFMARCLALDVDTPGAGDDEANLPREASDDLPDVDLGTRIEALRTFLARRSARPQAEADEADHVPSPSDPSEEFSPEIPSAPAAAPTATVRQERRRPLGVIASPLPDDWTRRLWLAAAAILTIGVVVAVILFGVLPWSRGPAMGKFSIDTRPAGIAITIDGMPRGVTPLSVDLTAGEHIVEVISGTDHRKIPITIRAGSDSSQVLEMAAAPSAPAATGTELRIRTEPLGAAVTIDGRSVGRTPVSISDLAPGPHTVVLKHEVGSATEQVLIEAGKASYLSVPLAPRSAPGSAAGWISVKAPADVQLFEDGRFLGSSRIDRIMVPTGRHELDIINDALGFQERRVVQVTAGQVTSISANWPIGTVSINASPWAQVFIDGMPFGETPIANARVPIGQHEILFRHPQLGEVRRSVTVTVRETAKVGIDLRPK